MQSNGTHGTMSSDEKIMEGGGEGSSHDAHQAITCTIHIMAPSDLGANAIDSALVASVEAQDTRQEGDSSLLVVPAEGEDAINVSAKNLIQTVTETNIGSVELPVISNINSDQVTEHTIELVTKDEKHLDDVIEEDVGCHCLICNEELKEDIVPVFKSFTTASQRKVSLFLGDLVGQKLTSRKTHSTIICDKCYKLLNKLDLLEFEIQETKEEIITKYQETVAAYGGRARRKKPAAAKKSDYVFPKIEPEDEEKKVLDIEEDDIYQPQVDDLLEEEQDRREDRDSLDEEWEPEVKRARIKRESNADPTGPPKRKRGRPRKDASKPKDVACHQHYENEQTFASELKPCDFSQFSSRPEQPAVESGAVLKEGSSSTEVGQEEEDPVKIFSDKQCPVCETGFLSVTELAHHFRAHHSSTESLSCSHCKMQLPPVLKSFVKHCKSCFPKEQQAKPTKWCGVCQKELTRSEYVKHMASHKMLPCPICREQFSKSALPKHMSTHGQKITKAFKCIDCSAIYNDASNLANHRKRNHLGQEARRHLCEVCGKKFVAPSELRIHVTTVHHNTRKYVCEFCGWRFKVASELSYHRRTHTGERPHVCKECGGAFIKPNALAKHVRLVHRMEYQGRYKKRLSKCQQNTKDSPPETSLISSGGASGSVLVSKNNQTVKDEVASSGTADVNVKVTEVYSLTERKWLNYSQL